MWYNPASKSHNVKYSVIRKLESIITELENEIVDMSERVSDHSEWILQ